MNCNQSDNLNIFHVKSVVMAMICFCTNFSAISQDNDWFYHKSKELSFNISTPCELEHKVKEVISDFGQMDVHSYYCQSDASDPNELYMITYTDYPPESFPSDSTDLIKEFYDQSIDQIRAQLGGELYYSSEQQINGKSGMIARITYNTGQTTCKAFVCLVENRFYAVQVFSKIESSLNDQMDRYINSFRTK